MERSREPVPLSRAISELIAARGLAKAGADEELAAAWRVVAGPDVASMTRVVCLRRGVLHVGVQNTALLGELIGYRQHDIAAQLKANYSHMKISDVKFVLRRK